MARNLDMSSDVVKLKEEIRRAEVRLQQMGVERDGLMDKLKVCKAVV